jgi:hypothetical protein
MLDRIGAAVEHDNIMAVLQQAQGDVAAHAPKPNDTQLHGEIL